MINMTEVLDTSNQIKPNARSLVEIFASKEGIGRRFLLGRNENSASLLKLFDINGLVDDFAEIGTFWNGIPVINGESLPIDAIVVNCSMSISPISASRRLSGLKIYGSLAYADFCKVFPDTASLPNFVLETREDFMQNQEKWEKLSVSFADNLSRQVLDDLLKYRLTGDYDYMSAYSVRFKDQYFEDFLGLSSEEVFVDAGGYDGDTTEEFSKRNPNYKKVYLFEPSLSNLNKAKQRLNLHHSIEFIDRGLSNASGSLWFNPDADSASSVCESGSTQIEVATLDQMVKEKVTFIKMDLEGWELLALEGSKRHILEDHPKLAISVYHHPSDFWRVYEFILALRTDYKVYLRHYTEGWSETVMYFVPQ